VASIAPGLNFAHRPQNQATWADSTTPRQAFLKTICDQGGVTESGGHTLGGGAFFRKAFAPNLRQKKPSGNSDEEGKKRWGTGDRAAASVPIHPHPKLFPPTPQILGRRTRGVRQDLGGFPPQRRPTQTFFCNVEISVILNWREKPPRAMRQFPGGAVGWKTGFGHGPFWDTLQRQAARRDGTGMGRREFCGLPASTDLECRWRRFWAGLPPW